MTPPPDDGVPLHRILDVLETDPTPVHVNTMRYRLGRFEELTGADLRDPEHLIEVSWALAAGPAH